MGRQRIVIGGVLACVMFAAFVTPAGAKPRWKLAPCTIVGTGRDDVLRGTGMHDVICARGGDDIVLALSGDDIVRGGKGYDKLHGDRGDDVLAGGPDRDRHDGGDGNDRMIGGRGKGNFSGGVGDDRMRGGAVGDTFYPGGGDDLVRAGSGADYIWDRRGDDVSWTRRSRTIGLGWRDRLRRRGNDPCSTLRREAWQRDPRQRGARPVRQRRHDSRRARTAGLGRARQKTILRRPRGGRSPSRVPARHA